MRRLAHGLVAAFILTALPLPTTGPASAADAPIEVVASFSILADFARAVGGERVKVTALVGPGGDAHVFEPRPADAASLAAADLVIVNGLGFEGFLPRLVAASGATAPVVEASKGAALVAAGEDAHAHGEHETHSADEAHGPEATAARAPDPHAWQSVPNAKVYVRNIADALCAADAAGCDAYRANAATYSATLDMLDRDLRAAVAAIPPERRTIITSHDAFGYLAHEYGLTFLAPEGVSTASEASAADVAALIRQVREDRASAIFVETVSDRRLIERIAAETGLRVGGELFSDALSAPDGPAATYLDMMRHNIRAIAGAVGGS